MTSPRKMAVVAAMTLTLATADARPDQPPSQGSPASTLPEAALPTSEPPEVHAPSANESTAENAGTTAIVATPNGARRSPDGIGPHPNAHPTSAGVTNDIRGNFVGDVTRAGTSGPTDDSSSLDRTAPETDGRPAVQLSGGLGPSAVQAPDRARRWLLSVSLGVQHCTGDWCTDSEGMDATPFMGQAFDAYLRLNDHVALGVGFSVFDVLADDDDATAIFFAGLGGVQGFVPLSGRVDLWGGLAAGYAWMLYDEDAWPDYYSYGGSLTFQGPVLAFSAGLDFWTFPWLTLGPSFTYYLTLWRELCATDPGVDACVDWDDLPPSGRDAFTLDYWMIALRTTVTL